MEAVPKGIFSNDFSLRLHGESMVELDVSSWREKAEFELAGTQYRLYREGLMSGAFILEAEGQVLARAIKPSALRGRFDLSVGDGSFTLRKLSAWSRRFGVFDGELEVGRICIAPGFLDKWLP